MLLAFITEVCLTTTASLSHFSTPPSSRSMVIFSPSSTSALLPLGFKPRLFPAGLCRPFLDLLAVVDGAPLNLLRSGVVRNPLSSICIYIGLHACGWWFWIFVLQLFRVLRSDSSSGGVQNRACFGRRVWLCWPGYPRDWGSGGENHGICLPIVLGEDGESIVQKMSKTIQNWWCSATLNPVSASVKLRQHPHTRVAA